MASFPVGLRADNDDVATAARQQVSTPFAVGSPHTAATSKARKVPPQATDVAETSVDTELVELEKVS